MAGLTPVIDAMGFKELDKNIQITMRRSAKDAVQLGYMLRRVLEEKLWAETYDTYDDYLQQGLHMDYTVASRFIGINKKYSYMGKSMDIKEEYQDYSQSLLVEMLNLPPELEEKVTPDTTIREIRQMKKESRQKPKSDIQIQAVSEEKIIDGEYREIEIPHDEGWFTEQYIKHFPSNLSEFMRICREQKNNADRAKEIQKYIAPYGYSSCSCNDYDFTFRNFLAGMDFRVGKESIHMKYGRFVQELLNLHDPFQNEKVATPQHMGDKKSDETSQDGDILADALQMDEQRGVPDVKNILDEQSKLLEDMLAVEGLPERTVVKQKIIVGALASMYTDLENMNEDEETQPELPVLKNNDQRKEWLERYKEWGLWYRDENIDVNYYKYDFPDGTRLIAAEYPQRERYYCKGQMDEVYYHLLEKNKKAYKWTYDEKYRQQANSVTELVEFLKNLQKK